MQINFTQTLVLTKNQIALLLKNKKYLLTITLISAMITLINFVSIFVCTSTNKAEANLFLINILIALNTLLFGLVAILTTVNCFIIQIKNNITNLEARYGFKNFSIYFSRIFLIMIVNLVIYFINFSIAMIFFAIIYKNKDILSYRMFVSSQGWYIIVIILLISITLLLSKFFNESLATALGVVSLFLLLIISASSAIYNLQSNSSYNDIIEDSFKEAAWNKIIEDETFKEISDEISEQTFQETIAWGFVEFDEDEKNSQVNYLNFQNQVGKYLVSDNQFSKWYPRGEDYTQEDKIIEINKSLLKIKELEKYKKIFEAQIELYKNNSFLKLLYVVNSGWFGAEFEQSFEIIENKFTTPDNYLFNRYFLNTIFLGKQFGQYNWDTRDFWADAGKNPKEIIKEDKIKNILNPFNHVALMFSGTDYNNPILYNYVSHLQNIFQNPINIDFSSKQKKSDYGPFKGVKLYSSVRVEVYYFIYAMIDIAIINLCYINFSKKIRG
ncbi:hypothetical protein [Spiroplasma alleghenense]|uniref:Uncharacterized protein n=1 Tax=Spiroplasma alleghenense TaxID=216931 RepID=A0A345Z2N7_9MOLU|nr:hypothetical protein [Spiroplasma alleghenense]AXK50866.1 hypothetical protein SALLE_v1c01900 [Spiroplasma alleghenense]